MEVNEKSLVLSVKAYPKKGYLKFRPSLNADYYHLELRDGNDALIKIFSLSKYSHYQNGYIDVEIPGLKENTDYIVRVISGNSVSAASVASNPVSFRTTAYADSVRPTGLLSMEIKNPVISNDAIIPSTLTYLAKSLVASNQNPDIKVLVTCNEDGTCKVDVSKTDQPALESFVSITVVANGMTTYTIPDLKGISLDTALAVRSNVPVLSQNADGIVAKMNNSFIISPSWLYRLDNDGTFTEVKKFNADRSSDNANEFTYSSLSGLSDGDFLVALSKPRTGFSKSEYSRFSNVLRVQKPVDAIIDSLTDSSITISFTSDPSYVSYDAKLTANDGTVTFPIFDGLLVKDGRTYLTYQGLQTGFGYELEVTVGIDGGKQKTFTKDFQTESFEGTYYYKDGNFIFAVDVSKPDNPGSKYPYYFKVNALDSSYDGTVIRTAPMVDDSIGEAFSLQNSYDANDYPYQKAYRWNSDKWNTLGLNPDSWSFGSTVTEKNKLVSITSSNAMGMAVQTYTAFDFRLSKDGRKQLIFTNRGYGSSAATVNMGLRTNPLWEEQGLESKFQFALTEGGI